MNSTLEECFDYLQSSNWHPQQAGENDLLFEDDGDRFVISSDKNGKYLRIIYLGFYKVKPAEIQKALKIANQINQTAMVGKIMIVDEHQACAFTDQFVDNIADLENFITSSITMMRKSSKSFLVEILGNDMYNEIFR